MPSYFKKNLLSDNAPKEIVSPLATPELPAPHQPVSEVTPQPTVKTEADHEYQTDDPTQLLLEWRAPARPFRKKDRSYYTTVAILITLVSAIAILAGERMLIGALFALGFLVYVLNFIPPEDIDYKISTQGITIQDHFYHWQELDSFWFLEKDGHQVLHVFTHLRFPAVLMLVLGETSPEEVKRVCAKYLPFHEIPPKSLIDKWSDSLQKHFPLENPHR